MKKVINMQSLELKVPPPLVALLIAVAMWGIAWNFPLIDIPKFFRASAAIAVALLGSGISLAGTIAFRRAKTTVNPMRPENASSLVCSGIYKITRNPMYVGLLFVLVAWGIFLSSVWALIGPLCFLLYINRFQIEPEERVLSNMFGESYIKYKSRVRRWL
jgi:protein-S-isoprenylcysteine O-methyltransferase Ste14